MAMANYGQKRKGPRKVSVQLSVFWSVSGIYVIPTLYLRNTDVGFWPFLGIRRGAPQQFIQLPPDPTMRNKMPAGMHI